jgi:hypothetical protein
MRFLVEAVEKMKEGRFNFGIHWFPQVMTIRL